MPAQRKKATYTKYVRALNEYLEGFLRRTQPLLDVEGEVVGPTAEARFDGLWKEGKVPGWPLEATGLAQQLQQGAEGAAGAPRCVCVDVLDGGLVGCVLPIYTFVRPTRVLSVPPRCRHNQSDALVPNPYPQPQPHRPVDLKNFHSAQALEALGLERLKEGLVALGMKCGGTLSQRAERLFSTKGKAPGQIDKKLLAKPSPATPVAGAAGAGAGGGENGGVSSANGGGNGNGNGGQGRADPRRTCAWLEFRVGLLAEALGEVVGATRKFVEKKQTRTQAELAAELREEEVGGAGDGKAAGGGDGGGEGGDGEEDQDDDDEDGPIYNPLNLPLGYDGKPIPYWLYKLHGLSVEYKCEICGNYSYWGRRAFDRHFQVRVLWFGVGVGVGMGVVWCLAWGDGGGGLVGERGMLPLDSWWVWSIDA